MMTKRSQEDMLLYCKPLSETTQTKLFTLIEKCISYQRRLETALMYLDDQNVEEAENMLEDTRRYRRVLVEDLVKTYEDATVLENIRICEKGITLMEPRLENVCVLAETKDSHSE